jgi:type IX secretion system PorP/SprF family membrane protein
MNHFLRYILIFFCLGFSKAYAQDIHFSHFFASPFNISPAQTGMFDGDYRFILNQKTQWRSVTKPYNTFGFSYDMNNAFNRKDLAIGLGLFNDKTGDSEFNTIHFAPSISYILHLKTEKKQNIRFGIQPAISNKRMDYSQLNFNNQYNGIAFDPNLSSNENFQAEGLTYFNLNAGIAYQIIIDERKSFQNSFGFFNINQPKQSFFNNNDIKLDRRLSYSAELNYMIAENVDIIPSFMFFRQGKYQEIVAGTRFKYYTNSFKGKLSALYTGAWMRAGDAAFLQVGADYGNVQINVSYDINYSDLNIASRYRGGFEFSMIYIFKKFTPYNIRSRVCPDYL